MVVPSLIDLESISSGGARSLQTPPAKMGSYAARVESILDFMKPGKDRATE
jgi:hypothetical protein